MGRNLTAPEIAELTQGQRLDFLVATTIFGLKPWPEQTGTLAYTIKPERPAKSRNISHILPATPPHFSEDLQSGTRVIAMLMQFGRLTMVWNGTSWTVSSAGTFGEYSDRLMLVALCVTALNVMLDAGKPIFDPCL